MMGIGTPKSQSRMPLPMIFLLMCGSGRKGDRSHMPSRSEPPSSGKAPNKAPSNFLLRGSNPLLFSGVGRPLENVRNAQEVPA